MDTDLSLEYNNAYSVVYDVCNNSGFISIVRKKDINNTDAEYGVKEVSLKFSFDNNSRLTKDYVLSQLQAEFGTE